MDPATAARALRSLYADCVKRNIPDAAAMAKRAMTTPTAEIYAELGDLLADSLGPLSPSESVQCVGNFYPHGGHLYGIGRCVAPSGVTFSGQLYDSAPGGLGCSIGPDWVYYGKMDAHGYCGPGRLTTADEEIVGTWSNGRQHGYCTHVALPSRAVIHKGVYCHGTLVGPPAELIQLRKILASQGMSCWITST